MSSIRTDLLLPQDPATVWRALTDPTLLAEWLMPNDFAPTVGHRFTFTTDPVPAHGFDGRIDCEVLMIDPPHRLTISWSGGNLDTTVTWTLTPERTGTRLRLIHDGFDDTDPVQTITKKILGGGWSGHLAQRLGATLAKLTDPA